MKVPRTLRTEGQDGGHGYLPRRPVGLDAEVVEPLHRDPYPLALKFREQETALRPLHLHDERRHLVEERVLQKIRLPERLHYAAPPKLGPVADRHLANSRPITLIASILFIPSLDTLQQRDNAIRKPKARPRLDDDLALRDVERITLRLVNRRAGRDF